MHRLHGHWVCGDNDREVILQENKLSCHLSSLGVVEESLFPKFLLSAATYGSKRSFSKHQFIARTN